jgi:hypothetical protein
VAGEAHQLRGGGGGRRRVAGGGGRGGTVYGGTARMHGLLQFGGA